MAEWRQEALAAAVAAALVRRDRAGELPSLHLGLSGRRVASLLERLEAVAAPAVAWRAFELPSQPYLVAATTCLRATCRPASCPCQRILTPAAADSLYRHWIARGGGRLRLTAALLADLLAAPSDAG
jgi:hypothetical protein